MVVSGNSCQLGEVEIRRGGAAEELEVAENQLVGGFCLFSILLVLPFNSFSCIPGKSSKVQGEPRLNSQLSTYLILSPSPANASVSSFSVRSTTSPTFLQQAHINIHYTTIQLVTVNPPTFTPQSSKHFNFVILCEPDILSSVGITDTKAVEEES